MPAQHNASRLQTDCMVVVSGPMVRLPDSHLYALWPQLRVANPVIIQEETSTSLHCMMRTCHGCCCACFDLSQAWCQGKPSPFYCGDACANLGTYIPSYACVTRLQRARAWRSELDTKPRSGF